MLLGATVTMSSVVGTIDLDLGPYEAMAAILDLLRTMETMLSIRIRGDDDDEALGWVPKTWT